jgi:hypothetical protein
MFLINVEWLELYFLVDRCSSKHSTLNKTTLNTQVDQGFKKVLVLAFTSPLEGI